MKSDTDFLDKIAHVLGVLFLAFTIFIPIYIAAVAFSGRPLFDIGVSPDVVFWNSLFVSVCCGADFILFVLMILLRRRKLILIFSILMVVIPAVGILSYHVIYTGLTVFTPEMWSTRPLNRYLMADSLQKQKLLEGRTRAQIENLLGKPDRTAPPSGTGLEVPRSDEQLLWQTSGYVQDKTISRVYYQLQDNSFTVGILIRYLMLEYDPSGKAVRYGIVDFSAGT